MIDQGLAAHLNATRPNLSWQDTMERYDFNWRQIIAASQRSAQVNRVLGVQPRGVADEL
jgi:filamentous hemagglutinin